MKDTQNNIENENPKPVSALESEATPACTCAAAEASDGSAPACTEPEFESADPQRLEDERFMRAAMEQAQLAGEEGEVPIGAVVVCQGEIIAEGRNHRETDQDPSAHAEFSAIMEASRELERWRLPDCTVYVTLEPCVMCAGLMHQARIGRCVYGAPDPKAGALGTLYSVHEDERLNHNFTVEAGILRDECAQILKDFFARRRKEKNMSGRKI